MTGDQLLDGDAVGRLVAAVAEALAPDGPQHVLVIAGGSLLAWHGLREATRDVDTIRRMDEELRDAVRLVASRHGLAANWLNDNASPFWPTTLGIEACEVLAEYPRLLALGVPLRFLFLMKLHRADPNDLADMQVIWPHIAEQFESAEQLVAEYQTAFPLAPHDDHLAGFVIDLLADAGFDLGGP